MKKIVFASLALATLAASPALAASHKHIMRNTTATAQNAYASAGYSLLDSNTVIVDGQIVGRDPDPFIRLQLLRDHGLEAN